MRRTVGRSRMQVVAAVSALLLLAGCHGPFSRIAPHARLDAVARVQLADGHDSIGTAFLVAPDVVVTARHVTVLPILYSDGSRALPALEIAWSDGRRVPVRGVLGDDSAADLVCLRLAAPVLGVTPLRLSPTAPSPEQPMTIVGFPGGSEYATSAGRVRSSETTGWSPLAQFVETSAKGSPGSSGAPMIGEDGDVLAVVHGGTPDHSLVGARADRLRPLLVGSETPWGEWSRRIHGSVGERSRACTLEVAGARAGDARVRRRMEVVTRLGLATATAPFADERELWIGLLSLQPDAESEARVLRELESWIAGRPGRDGARIAKIEWLFGRQRHAEVIADYDRYRTQAPFHYGMGAYAAIAALDAKLAPRLDAAEEAVLEEPGWAFAWRALADSRWVAGDYTGFASAFLRHEELRPDDPDVSTRRGAFALALALELTADPHEALEMADQALLHPGAAVDERFARAAKALALAQLGEFAKAEASIADVEALGAEWGTWFRATIAELRRRATSPSK